MQLSVAICTWNRAALLDRTLEAFEALRVPEGVAWELIVVNNNSTDETPAVLARHRARLPLVILDEPIAGQSQARNTALAHARGELVVWTDDDVLIDADWLSHYAAAAREFPHAGFFGGTIDPLYESTPPAWVEQNLHLLAGAYALARSDSLVRPLKRNELPFGANMALRTSLLGDLRFDTRIGLKQNDHIRGDETDLLGRLRERGIVGVWVGPARVRHWVPAARLSSDYVWKYNVGYGRTVVRLDGPPEGRRFRGAPRWLYRLYWQKRSQAAARRALGRTDWVLPWIEAARAEGTILETREWHGAQRCAPVAARERREALCP